MLTTYVDVLPKSLTNIAENTVTSFVVYPNPAKDVIQLKRNNLEDVINIEILDATGRKVYQSNKFEEQIKVSGLHRGIYILKIKTNTGYTTTKIVKE